jgi:hypothetical protein
VIVDFLWGGVAPHAMNHARPGGRYIQVGNSAGPRPRSPALSCATSC